MTNVKAFAAREQRDRLKAFSFDLEPPKAEEVEIEIMHCGICHTDLIFLDNEWGNIPFPLVPGHEIVGRITKLGDVARDKGLQIGQIFGQRQGASDRSDCRCGLDEGKLSAL